jgi:hypothetical protein
MTVQTITGTAGTPARNVIIFVVANCMFNSTYYAQKGASAAASTSDEISEGVNLENVSDDIIISTSSHSGPIESIEDLLNLLSIVSIRHPEENKKFYFKVNSPEKLNRAEVCEICEKMNVRGIFVNGKIYQI